MKVICFSSHGFELTYLEEQAKKQGLEVCLIQAQLNKDTASLASGYQAISCWANDDLSGEVLVKLKELGVQYISLRTAGFSHVDRKTCESLDIRVARVPAYSPEAIAEHTLGLLMCLNRKFPRAFQRVKDFNYTLDGLEGLTLFGKNVGVIGLGKIGIAFARIMKGMGCNLFFYDVKQDSQIANELNATYTGLEELLRTSDIVSLHCPLNSQTRYLLNSQTLSFMKKDAFLLNTGRGGLIETAALIEKLKKKELRGVGLDVYEYEENLFFHDHSEEGITDEMLLRLMGFPNVLITSHQAFLTKEALVNIAQVSMENVFCFLKGLPIDPARIVTS